ncbi:MAG TPA: hypothetical protein VLX92_26700 [Kofleriaceae bacterium]|nr:hypothetical protein [Kofleriaceae bacterium]
MDRITIAVRLVRASGVLLVALGIVHLIATPHIPHLLDASPAVAAIATGPTVLNHVLVGVLLLPLGYTTWLAAPAARAGERWARRVLVANAAAVAALPISIVLFMRGARYFTAPLFVAGVALVGAAATTLAVAVWLVLSAGDRRS